MRLASEQKAAGFLKKEVLEIADGLVEEFPENEVLRIFAVEAHLMCLNYTKAKALLEKGIGLNPRYGEFYQRMACIALHHGEYDKAITYWKKTLEISPERSELNMDIAEAIMSSGKYRQVIKELQKYIEIFPKSDLSYYLLGQAYLQLKEYHESKKYFEKAIEIRPNNPYPNYGLATVYMRLKQRDKAEHYLKLFKQLEAERFSSKSDEVEKRDKPVIRDTSIYELKVFPKILMVLCISGSRFYQINQNTEKHKKLLDKGEKAFVEVINIAPEMSDLYREFARFYLRTNRKTHKAIKIAQKAVSLDGTALSYFVLSESYYKNSKLSKALNAIQQAIKLDPDNYEYKQKYNMIKGER